MKARLPHAFFTYASNFTLESMLKAVSFWAKEVYNNHGSKLGSFASTKKYRVMVGKRLVSGEAYLVPTWLINMFYSLITLNNYGDRRISCDETLYLISRYNDYLNEEDGRQIRNTDPELYVYGFAGEQMLFQDKGSICMTFAREKYILEQIPCKPVFDEQRNINVPQEFEIETGVTTDNYACLLLIIWTFFADCLCFPSQGEALFSFNDPRFSLENTWTIINRYSADVNAIRSSSLQRQALYKTPFVLCNNEYICSSPFLLGSLFSNAIYWIIRDKYRKLGSPAFTNEFGYYFEAYVKEILMNCLDPSKYQKIPKDEHDKRADWHVILGEYEFIVEQKSSLSALNVKQSHPDVEKLKQHLLRTWGEAIEQLESTEIALSLEKPIKVILLYDDYFRGGCLDKVFKLNPDLKNDGRYWVLSINEFENLLWLFKHDSSKAFDIIKEKDEMERSDFTASLNLEEIMRRHNIHHNAYLKEFGVLQEFEKISDTINSIK